MPIKEDIQSLSPSAMVELFVLDTTNLPGGAITRFHAGVNGIQTNVWWQGNEYQALPIEADGFDISAKGTLPRPKVRVANIDGLFSAAVRDFDDLVGCKITRKRTYAKYLDAANFPARRNLQTNTGDMRTSWTRGGALTLAEQGAESPDGTNSGLLVGGLDGLAIGAAASTVYSGANIPVVAGQSITHSVWFKPLSNGTFSIRHYSGAGDDQSAHFPVKAGDPWVRYSATFMVSPTPGPSCQVVLGTSGGPMSGVLFGAQTEHGAEMTDYQPVGASFSGNPTADPNQHLPDDLWFVERKVGENRYIVEWELSSAFDLQGVMLPARQVVQNSCQWIYRGAECGYAGGFVDINDNPAFTADADCCPKTLASCKARFGSAGVKVLNFGGFPGARRDI